MKKLIYWVFMLFFLSAVSGCIVSSNPDEEVITISPGEAVYFKVVTNPASEKVTWYVDEIVVQEGGKEFSYIHDALDQSEEHVVMAKTSLVPYKNEKTWVVNIPRLAPVLNDLSIKGTGKTSVTLNDVTLSQSGNPEPDVEAYLGVKNEITENAGSIENFLEGPCDVRIGTYRFDGLDEAGEYTIYVVAKNSEGTSVKNIDVDLSVESVVNPDDYQGMTKEELGHLLWAKKISDMELDDFSLIPSVRVMGIPITGDMQLGPASHRYVLAFSCYFMAAEQFHKLPACTEIIQPIFDRYIQKMLTKRAWTYWAFTSMGIIFPEPTLMWPTYPSERDPVVRRNIMYSGHLAHMMTLYEKFYEPKWTGDNVSQFTGRNTAQYAWHPDANDRIVREEVQDLIEHKDYTVDQDHSTFSFKWNDEEEYRYNLPALLQVLFDQTVFMKSNCVECEPNCCFSPCNSHHPLAFILHDQTHAYQTNFSEANDHLMDWFLKTKQFDPVTHEVAHFWLVKQEQNITNMQVDLGNLLSLATIPLEMVDDYLGILNLKAASLSGWTGTFMNTWQPEYMNMHYPHQKESKVSYYAEGKARIVLDWFGEQYSNGFFAGWAAEMGDSDLRDKLVAYTEELYNPIWGDDGSFHYPNGFDNPFNPFPFRNPYSMPLTGKLVALARAIPPSGISKMHNNDFTGKDENTPMVVDVDFPNVLLKRAVYDDSKDALIVSTTPGALNTLSETDISVKNLDDSRSWSLYIDGEYYAAADISNGVTVITVALDDDHDYVLRAD